MSTILAIIAVVVILVVLFNIVMGLLTAIVTNPVALALIAVAIYVMYKLRDRKLPLISKN